MINESEEMIIQMIMIHLKKSREEAIEYYKEKLCNKVNREYCFYSKVNELTL
ncbi:hypothetical protein [Vibrio pectenicida]|uniref:hypothetical protein n=1 Tax=Vibrio pectenicida TaxID=62763 RepID=UPI00148BC523|nr:hypothetical protein [Vibrio pectenicida]